MKNKPIGIFDSGLGGLTVTRAIRNRLPYESVIYYGDTARVPYGSKSKETVIRFTWEAVQFLLNHNAKCIVVACNTASALALHEIRNKINVPIIGVINPGAAAAAQNTNNNKIGVIATTATINSEAYTEAIRKLKPESIIYAQPCPLFVPLVEEGWANQESTKLIIKEYLNPLRAAGIDTLVLGCTHYPLLVEQLQEFMGSKVALMDSASTCTSELETLLKKNNLLASEKETDESFFVTDMASRFSELGTRFLGRQLQAIKVVGKE